MIYCNFTRAVSQPCRDAEEGNPALNGLVDRIGIGLSGVCLLHCIGSMMLVAMVASVGGLALNPIFHEVGLFLAIPLGLYAFTRGFRVHGRSAPAVVGVSGLLAMAFALSLKHGAPAELGLTIAGVVLLAIGHFLNVRASAGRC